LAVVDFGVLLPEENITQHRISIYCTILPKVAEQIRLKPTIGLNKKCENKKPNSGI
jgi:hypothetical protein